MQSIATLIRASMPGDTLSCVKEEPGKGGLGRASLTVPFTGSTNLIESKEARGGMQLGKREKYSFMKNETHFISFANSLFAFLQAFTIESQKEAGERQEA